MLWVVGAAVSEGDSCFLFLIAQQIAAHLTTVKHLMMHAESEGR